MGEFMTLMPYMSFELIAQTKHARPAYGYINLDANSTACIDIQSDYQVCSYLYIYSPGFVFSHMIIHDYQKFVASQTLPKLLNRPHFTYIYIYICMYACMHIYYFESINPKIQFDFLQNQAINEMPVLFLNLLGLS